MTEPTTPARRIIPIRPQTQAASPGPNGVAPLAFQTPPPLALYVHIPWCVRKCPYCDFNSHKAPATLPQEAYLDALILDLEQALPLIWGRPIVSLFFGGGTPSLISGEGINHLLTQIRMRLKVLPGAEITLEANPGTVESDHFPAYRAAGVNRLSLGIQSFNDSHLQALGRIHNRANAEQAIRLAMETFERVNLDLMYGLPGQTPEQARDDLATALAYGPSHLSCYQLTLEPNTPFAAHPPELPDEESCADMQDHLETHLAAAGYEHYETSAFALPGQQSQHNLNYWQFGDYLGIGAGAHSKLTQHDRVIRQMRHKHPEAYLRAMDTGNFVQERTEVSAHELPGEFMMNALRLTSGFTPALFETRTAQAFDRVEPILLGARKEGLIEVESGLIRPTAQGRRFLNRLIQRFL